MSAAPGPSQPQSQLKPTEIDDEAIDLSTLNEYENEIDWLDDLLNRQDTNQSSPNSAQESLYNLDKKLSKLLIILENSISDTSNIVESSITEIESSIPRLTFDLQLMRENSLLLRYSLESIQSKSKLNHPSNHQEGIDEEALNESEIPIEEPNLKDSTDLILSRLKTLDLVKSRMEASRVVLEEAEAWSTLESEVTGYLTDPIPSYLKAAERLSEANKSMIVFQHTPEYEGRRALMRSLQNELEASLSTNLVKALSEKDVQRCKEFYLIFKMIEREGEFKNYYFGSRRSSISNLWKDAKLIGPILNFSASSFKASNQETLPMFLKHQFYPNFIKLLQTELDFLPHIFNNPVQTLSAFIKTTVELLQPSIGSQLNDMLDSAHILAGLPALINSWTITEDLGYMIENLIIELENVIKNEKSSSSPALPMDPVTDHQPKAHARKASMKRPISRRSGSRSGGDLILSDGMTHSTTNIPQILETITEWEIALYEPFIDFQTSYYDRELEYLSSSVINLNNQTLKASKMLTNDTNALTTHASKIIPEMLSSLFDLGEEAINRCEAFTHGYSIIECLNSIDKTLAEYLNSITAGLSQERENRELRKQIGRGHQLNPNENNSYDSHHHHHQSYNESDLSDLEGLDYSGEDWEMFQTGLKLLSTLKSTYTKLNQFEKKTLNRLTEILGRLVHNEHESLGMMDGLKFTKIKMSKGAKTLLKESRLNSKELWELIELVLPGQGKTESTTTGRKSSIGLGQTPDLNPTPIRLQTRRSTNSQIQLTKEVPKFYLNLDQSYKKLIKETQTLIQSVILSPLLKDIEDYSNLNFWNQTESNLKSSQQTTSISTLDLKILNELSKSPNELMIKLGEGLLNLPRLFEMIKEEEGKSLSFMIDLLPLIEKDEECLKNLRRQQQEEVEVELNFELIISTWLTSLSLNVLEIYLNQVLENKILKKYKLNPISKNQLMIDLEYLGQVLKALDIDCSSLDEFKETNL